MSLHTARCAVRLKPLQAARPGSELLAVFNAFTGKTGFFFRRTYSRKEPFSS